MTFEAYDMEAELGFKKKVNELLRRESSNGAEVMTFIYGFRFWEI